MDTGRKNARPAAPDEEILKYDNVPVEIAAAYIGIGAQSLRYAMQDRMYLERCSDNSDKQSNQCNDERRN